MQNAVYVCAIIYVVLYMEKNLFRVSVMSAWFYDQLLAGDVSKIQNPFIGPPQFCT